MKKRENDNKYRVDKATAEELEQMNRELNDALGTKGRERASDRKQPSRMKELKRSRIRSRLAAPLIVLGVLVLLLGGAAGTGLFLLHKGKTDLLAHQSVEGVDVTAPADAVVEENGRRVTWQGRQYVRNENIITLLFLGVDRKSEETARLIPGENGQADTIVVGALDVETGRLRLLNISRDAMTDIDLYNEDGAYVSTERMQICLSYAYGSSDVSGCENTAKAVSRLLYGMPVDAYASITVPAIRALNDAIGGVEVVVLEDMSDRDPALAEGEKVILAGEQVNLYLISRDWYSTDANNARMARQKQYAAGFINKVFTVARRDPSIVLTLYEAARANLTTDLKVSGMLYLVRRAMNTSFSEEDILTVPGEIVRGTTAFGEEHAEYNVDDEALYSMILELFYTQV